MLSRRANGWARSRLKMVGVLSALTLLGGVTATAVAEEGVPPKRSATEALSNQGGVGEGLTVGLQRARGPRLVRVDGGPGYYGRFTNGLPTSPAYFPIGVWFESVTSQADIDKDKEAGLNLYVVLTRNSDLGLVRRAGMHAFVQQSEWNGASLGSETAGWELEDEIDMERSPEDGFGELRSILRRLPRDGRMRWNNYGKGVLFWLSDRDAARYVNDFQDIISSDTYWFTDNHVCGQGEGGAFFTNRERSLADDECHRASNYGRQVARLRSLVRPRGSKPVWAFVELGHPFSEDHFPTITPPQVRAAVWHSLIAGARGITYFNHSFAGRCTSQHILREPCYAPIRATVRSVNAQIRSLARVLNAPTLASGFTSTGTVRAMAKFQGGNFYVFAGSVRNRSSDARFRIQCAGNATATVLGEGRQIPVRGGAWSDRFADGNAIHIYRIDGGSKCGLG